MKVSPLSRLPVRPMLRPILSLLASLVALPLFPPARAATVFPPQIPDFTEIEKPSAELNEAREAIAKKDYLRAHGILAEKAKQGDASAFFGLGYLYQAGLGVPVSMVAAETFYRRSASFGYIPAMYNLATLQLAKPESSKEGKEWLVRAAENGSGRAALALGRLLAEGPDAKANAAEAESWFRKAVKAPEIMREAAFTLAVFLDPTLSATDARGQESRRFLQTAADAGYLPAVLALSDAWLRTKDGGARALEVLAKASAAGFHEATFRLAALHLEGRVVKPDPVLAVQLLQKAAEADHPMACNQLAVMYQEGKGVAINKSQAYEWFRQGAELGLPMAQFNTGVCLEDGIGVDRNLVRACEWYGRAALAGYSPAQNRLALRYQEGKGVLKDPVAARAWMKEAAQHGFEAAILNYATMLMQGEGGPVDLPTAVVLYKSLATKNDPNALYGLGLILESGAGPDTDPARALALHQLASNRHPAAKARAEALQELVSEADKAKAAAFVKDPRALFERPLSQSTAPPAAVPPGSPAPPAPGPGPAKEKGK